MAVIGMPRKMPVGLQAHMAERAQMRVRLRPLPAFPSARIWTRHACLVSSWSPARGVFVKMRAQPPIRLLLRSVGAAAASGATPRFPSLHAVAASTTACAFVYGRSNGRRRAHPIYSTLCALCRGGITSRHPAAHIGRRKLKIAGRKAGVVAV